MRGYIEVWNQTALDTFRRWRGAEPQVTDQLRTMSPRCRAADLAIAKRTITTGYRPLCGLG